MSTKRKKCCNQRAGGSTDYAQLFYSYGADPAQLSRMTLSAINKAPMFNPLKSGTVFPTGTSGIIPTGSYYASTAPLATRGMIPMTPGYIQMGGDALPKSKRVLYTTREGKEITNPWIAHVYKFAELHNISYNSALKHPNIKDGYVKKTK